MTKILDEFDLACEESKINFQTHIGSILEMHTLLKDKLLKAHQNNKEGAFFTNSEMQVLSDWLLQASTNLLADYESINRTNKITNKLYKCSLMLIKRKSPDLKDLAA